MSPRADWETDENGDVIAENLRPNPYTDVAEFARQMADPSIPISALRTPPQRVVRERTENEVSLDSLRGVRIISVFAGTRSLTLRTSNGTYRIANTDVYNGGSSASVLRRITCSQADTLRGATILSARSGGCRTMGNIRSRAMQYRYASRLRIKFWIENRDGGRQSVVATLISESNQTRDMRPYLKVTRDAS